MSRGKKDIQVDDIRHASGITVVVMFNPNQPGRGHENTGLTFWAKVGDKEFRATSADKVKADVYKYLDDNSKLVWHPVIQITELAPFASNRPETFVGFELERYYLAEAVGQKHLRKLKWRDYEPDDENWMTKKEYEKLGNIDIGRINASTEYHQFKGKLPESLPFRCHGHDKENFVVPYDEAQWIALQQIQEGISRLKNKLRSLTGTVDGLKQLEVMGAAILKALPAPGDSSSEK